METEIHAISMFEIVQILTIEFIETLLEHLCTLLVCLYKYYESQTEINGNAI
jgi:hypothetical protein